MSGSSRANRGRRLQDLLDMVCEQYKRKGIANINPVPVPYKRVRNYRGNLWVGVYTGKSTVDYVGITAGGRAVAFDAKQTDIATRVDLSPTHFPEHQREFLVWYDCAGHEAFLVVEFTQLHEIYRVPISPVIMYLALGHSSLPIAMVREVGTQLYSDRGILLDVLAGI